MKPRHWETHLYTLATMLLSGDAIRADALLGVRRKCARQHTEGEIRLVERKPTHFIRHGFKGLTA